MRRALAPLALALLVVACSGEAPPTGEATSAAAAAEAKPVESPQLAATRAFLEAREASGFALEAWLEATDDGQEDLVAAGLVELLGSDEPGKAVAALAGFPERHHATIARGLVPLLEAQAIGKKDATFPDPLAVMAIAETLGSLGPGAKPIDKVLTQRVRDCRLTVLRTSDYDLMYNTIIEPCQPLIGAAGALGVGASSRLVDQLQRMTEVKKGEGDLDGHALVALAEILAEDEAAGEFADSLLEKLAAGRHGPTSYETQALRTLGDLGFRKLLTLLGPGNVDLATKQRHALITLLRGNVDAVKPVLDHVAAHPDLDHGLLRPVFTDNPIPSIRVIQEALDKDDRPGVGQFLADGINGLRQESKYEDSFHPWVPPLIARLERRGKDAACDLLDALTGTLADASRKHTATLLKWYEDPAYACRPPQWAKSDQALPHQRHRVLKVLSILAPEDLAPQLVAALDDPSPALRLHAIEKLRAYRAPEAVLRLLKLRVGEDEKLRQATDRPFETWIEKRRRWLPAELAKALMHQDAAVRKAAVELLGRCGVGGRPVIPDLEALKKKSADDADLVAAIDQALAAIGPAESPAEGKGSAAPPARPAPAEGAAPADTPTAAEGTTPADEPTTAEPTGTE